MDNHQNIKNIELKQIYIENDYNHSYIILKLYFVLSILIVFPMLVKNKLINIRCIPHYKIPKWYNFQYFIKNKI